MALTLTNVQEAFQVGSHVPMLHVLLITDFTEAAEQNVAFIFLDEVICHCQYKDFI